MENEFEVKGGKENKVKICWYLPKFEDVKEIREETIQELKEKTNENTMYVLDTSLKTPKRISSKPVRDYSLSTIFYFIWEKGSVEKAEKLINNFTSYYEYLVSLYKNFEFIATKELCEESKKLLDVIKKLEDEYCDHKQHDKEQRKRRVANIFCEGIQKFRPCLEEIISEEEEKWKSYQKFLKEDYEKFISKEKENDEKILITAAYLSKQTKRQFLILTADRDFITLLNILRNPKYFEISEKAKLMVVCEFYLFDKKLEKPKMILEIYDAEGRLAQSAYNIRKTC